MTLRDIYSNNEPNNISLHTESQGNGSGLGHFHTINPEDRAPNNTGKIVGALAVALMVGAAGIGLYASSGSTSHAKPVVTAANLPSPPPAPAPVSAPQQDAMTAPADANTAAAPAATPVPEPMKSADATPAPVKEKVVKSTRTAKADTSTDHMASTLNGDKSQTVVPKQTAATEPVSPTPSPNDLASNTTQSSVAVQPNATTASDMPAAQPQEQANTASPVAPEQTPAMTAPAEQPATATPAPVAPATEAAPAAQPAPAPAQ